MAGTEVGSLYYDLNIDDKNLKKQLDSADRSVKGFGDHISAYWGNSVDASRKFALGLAAVGAGVVAFGVSSVKAFADSENQIAQTNAVLKSTGGIAGVTADQVTKLANAMERQTRFSDEEVRSAENLLLTFTSIGKDIFPEATRTVLDMATALGTDTKSASIQLGKALQDPILGVSALRRVGVNFSQKQQDVIKSLVETGHAAEAQKMILKELNTEFGGSAVAAGDTLAGQLDKLKNQFNNVQEAIGGLIARVATPLLGTLLKWFDRIGGVEGALELLRKELDRLKPYLPVIAGAIVGILVPAFLAAAGAAGTFLLTVAPWAAAGAAIVLVAREMGVSWEDVADVLKRVQPYVVDLWQALFRLDDMAKQLVNNLLVLWQRFNNLTVIIIIGQYIQQVLWPALQAVWAAIVQNLVPALKQLWDSFVRLYNALEPGLTTALKIIGAIILGLLMVALWTLVSVLNVVVQAFSMVISVISNVINWISNLISWYGNLQGVIWNATVNIINIFRNLIPAVRDVVSVVIGLFGWMVGGLYGAAGQLFGAIRNTMWGAVNTIWGFYGTFVDAGWGLIRAFANGIRGAAGEAVNAARNVLQSVRNNLPFSDAKEGPLSDLTLSGRRFSETFAKGITQASGVVTGAVQSALNVPMDALQGSITIAGANALSGSSMAPATASSGSGGATMRAGDTIVNIGTVQDRSDADYILDRLDQNQRLQSRGVAPV